MGFRRSVVFLVVGLIACMCGATRSVALDHLRVFRGSLILEGKIETGDYASVRNFLRDESNFKKISN